MSKHLHIAIFFSTFYTIGKHRVAKRAGRRNNLRTRIDSFTRPFPVHAGAAFFFFFKHLCAAGAAAKTIFFTTFHFYQFGIKCFQHKAWCFINTIGSTEVTAIMIRDALAFEGSGIF